MLLILQPQSDEFNAYTLLPVLSAICYAATMILTRSHCRNEKPLVLSLWLNFGFVLAGVCAMVAINLWQPDSQLVSNYSFLLGDRVEITVDGWKSMAILAVAIIIGSVGTVIAYQNGPPAIIATLDYSYLVFAAIWGFVFFDEIPIATVVAGIALILSGGVLAIRSNAATPPTRLGAAGRHYRANPGGSIRLFRLFLIANSLRLALIFLILVPYLRPLFGGRRFVPGVFGLTF
ncbi:MAG: drug/metabolite transporter (DMT)-like permease [Planctomycetota bacterium]|jgi:drug/metabolite transporter (DMT)-like permease